MKAAKILDGTDRFNEAAMSFRKIEGESTVKPYGIHQI